MKLMKKLTALVLAAAMAVSLNLPVTNVKAADWTQSGAYGAVVNYKTPENAGNADLLWSYRPKEGWYAESMPIIAGDYIYTADANSGYLVKLTKDGKRVNEGKGKLADTLYWVANICYGDGKIFVPLDNGRIQAFDADTLDSVWISEPTSNSDAITSKLTYHEGYVYGGNKANAEGAGAYYAIKTEDEDSNKTEEEKKFAWTYTEADTSFYWEKGTVIGNYFVVGDLSGKLLVLDRKTGNKVDEAVLDSGFSGAGITYDEKSNTFYFISNNTVVYQYRLSSDGKLQEMKRSKPICSGGYSASTPTISDGRLYVGGRNGSYGSKGFLAVVDADTLELQYKAEAVSDVQSQPLVTTAYGTSANQNQTVVYFTANNKPGAIYYITDSKTAGSAVVKELFVPENSKQNYCMSDVIADEDGTLYYKNDSNYIFAVGKKTSDSETPKPETKPETKPDQTAQEKVQPITYHKDSKRKVKVSWKKKSGAKGYVIYAKGGKGKYKKLKTVGKVTAKTVTVKSGYHYRFRVRPFKYVKKGKKSVRKYYKSVGAKGKNGAKTVTATFGNVKGYQGYAVYMKVGKGSYRKVKDSAKGGEISYIKKKAKVGKTYTFCLKGYKIIKGKKVYTMLKTKRI